MSRKVRSNKARVVTIHSAYLLVSEMLPAPLLGCQSFTESKQGVAQSSRQWQKYIFIISAALGTCGGGRCGAGLSRNGREAKASFYWGWEFAWFLHCDTPRGGWHQGDTLSYHHQIEFRPSETTYVGIVMYWIKKKFLLQHPVYEEKPKQHFSRCEHQMGLHFLPPACRICFQ